MFGIRSEDVAPACYACGDTGRVIVDVVWVSSPDEPITILSDCDTCVVWPDAGDARTRYGVAL